MLSVFGVMAFGRPVGMPVAVVVALIELCEVGDAWTIIVVGSHVSTGPWEMLEDVGAACAVLDVTLANSVVDPTDTNVEAGADAKVDADSESDVDEAITTGSVAFAVVLLADTVGSREIGELVKEAADVVGITLSVTFAVRDPDPDAADELADAVVAGGTELIVAFVLPGITIPVVDSAEDTVAGSDEATPVETAVDGGREEAPAPVAVAVAVPVPTPEYPDNGMLLLAASVLAAGVLAAVVMFAVSIAVVVGGADESTAPDVEAMTSVLVGIADA